MNNEKCRLGYGGARAVADLFGMSERAVRAKAAAGEWPSYRIGRRRVFDLDELVLLVKATAPRNEQSNSAGGAA